MLRGYIIDMKCPVCKEEAIKKVNASLEVNVWLDFPGFTCKDHFVIFMDHEPQEISYYSVIIGEGDNQFRLTASKGFNQTKITKNDTGQKILCYDLYIEPEIENDMPTIEKVLNRLIKIRAFA